MTGFIATLLLSGCVSGAAEPDPPEGLTTRDTQDEGGDSAQLSGVLAEVDGCFYIDDAEGQRWVAVFPTEIVDESSTGSGFSLLGEDYADGDEISVGGSAAQSISYPVPEECDADLAQWQVHPEG